MMQAKQDSYFTHMCNQKTTYFDGYIFNWRICVCQVYMHLFTHAQ